MNDLLTGTKPMIMIAAIAIIIVFIAMMIDFASGLYKAYLRGDAHKSEAMKRTGFKFCLYIGSMMIATGVDLLIHFSKLYLWFGFAELVYGLPIVTLLLGIFWCVVEFLSVREKADEKIHSDISRAEKLAKQVLSKEEWIEILAEAIGRSRNREEVCNKEE